MVTVEYYDYNKSPDAAGSLRLSASPAYWPQLKSAVKDFGDQNGMTVLERQLNEIGDKISFEVWTRDILISGANSFAVSEFKVFFYADPKDPKSPVRLAKAMTDFSTAMKSVPGVTLKANQ